MYENFYEELTFSLNPEIHDGCSIEYHIAVDLKFKFVMFLNCNGQWTQRSVCQDMVEPHDVVLQIITGHCLKSAKKQNN
ncbi:hypothetical protein T4A_7089 [Trichinella pseudospiralis]|uniref:Uncharacterized protein n=1 Tax=Trichinella pseudospiralis TaxID=6337 RepID=A0A0V1EF05_TRIPS|nr:hypothetical protein T4A_7089 [Trichinella pseudospiralis]